jgi:carbon monoxide dehydrogenase subunit G
MEISGSHTFKAPQKLVWQVITDPATLRKCLPGCEEFELQGDGSYKVTLTLGIGAIKGTYTGMVHMLNEQPYDSYDLKVSAKGGAGFVDGKGTFVLAPDAKDGEKTVVNYTGEANAGGKIAGLGQRVIKAAAQFVAGQFFKALDKEVTQVQVAGSG